MTASLQSDLGQFFKLMMGILASRSMTLAQKLDNGGRLIQHKVHAGQASVMLYDAESNQLKVVAATRQGIVGMTQILSPDTVSGYVCTTKEPLLIADIGTDCRFPCRASTYRTTSLASVPLLSGHGHVIGVINVSDKDGGDPFTRDDLDVLLEYAGWITPLIETLCVQDRLEKEKERYRELAQELETKRQELLIASTERAELVQMVVHDFKSPLSAVISNMDLLSFLGPSEAQKPIIDTAFKGASNLLDMIDEFLHLARLDEWQERGAEPRSVHLLSLIRDKVDEQLPVARSKNISIENSCALDAPVWGDEVLFGHLVQNLISNAVKYTPDNGRIILGMETWRSRRATDPGQTVLKFFVEDDGPGIEDAFKERIFEKFVRTDSSHASGVKGTGVGLFICRKIAAMFKGKIWVEDVLPHGSRFCVIFFVAEVDGHRDQDMAGVVSKNSRHNDRCLDGLHAVGQDS